MAQRDYIFISHATPQNNYFAGWLASKLKILGYRVWVDMDDSRTGDSFNSVIEPIIKNESKVFLALTSTFYKEKAEIQSSGVSRELNCADTVKLDHNFILPIKIDAISHSNFPYQYQGWNAISFHPSWQSGLIDLIKELDKLNVPKNVTPESPLPIWFETIKSENKVIDRNEKYFSNWFPITLPSKIFIHFPETLDKRFLFTIPYPFTIESQFLITFASSDAISDYVKIAKSFDFDLQTFSESSEINISQGVTLIDPRKKLVRLLNNCFQVHAKNHKLIEWRKGKKIKKKHYYFVRSTSERSSVPLKRYNKPRGRRDLTGQTTEIVNGENRTVNWHFTISPSADLQPLPHFKIFYSLTFTNESQMRFEKDLHHKFRRSIPSDWYNRKWLETLLAAMLKISTSYESEFIRIPINSGEYLLIDNMPFNGVSLKGYIEPSDAG
ncbi:MAG: toll/interleukin-1 receptor domain-containing protein [Bacteroidota bacterium]